MPFVTSRFGADQQSEKAPKEYDFRIGNEGSRGKEKERHTLLRSHRPFDLPTDCAAAFASGLPGNHTRAAPGHSTNHKNPTRLNKPAIYERRPLSCIDFTIEARGFDPNCVAIAVRTIGSCYAMGFQPDSRIMTGIGLLSVGNSGDHYTFAAEAKALADDETPDQLLDWLEMRLSSQSAVVSWHNWGSVPARLVALADPARHTRVCAAASDVAGRWRALPPSHTWHLRQAPANTMPCLCPTGSSITDCQPIIPSVLLPDPTLTERQLINDATAGWRRWAQDFGDFDDDQHPAQQAIRAFARWNADRRGGDEAPAPR